MQIPVEIRIRNGRGLIRTFSNVDRHCVSFFFYSSKSIKGRNEKRKESDQELYRSENKQQINALGRVLLRNLWEKHQYYNKLVAVFLLPCSSPCSLSLVLYNVLHAFAVIIQTRYFCHHSSIHFTTSHPRILVTTPSTFVLASLNSINCPSLTNSDWLMNSKTTLALSPVLMRPEG